MMPWIFVHIASGNDLLSIWCQAITWTNVALLSTERLGTINMYHFPFKKMHLNMPSQTLLACKLCYAINVSSFEHLNLTHFSLDH